MSNPDRKYHLLSLSVILLFLLSGFLTVGDYGMGWDEVTRWKSGDAKLEYYQQLFSGERDFSTSRMQGDRYPGLFDLPLAAWNACFGGNRMDQGHRLSILFGALGLLATAWLANTVFGARTAFLATLFLAVLPHFYGHAMMNPKDIPFMAAYTLGQAAVLALARELAKAGKAGWIRYLLTGAAIGLAGAARVPGLVLLPLGGLAWLASGHLAHMKKSDFRKRLGAVAGLVGGSVLAGLAAILLVLIFFPRAQLQLFSSLPTVAAGLHSSASRIPLLFAGQVSDAGDGPFAYAHRFFLISTPLWMLALMVLGLVQSLNKAGGPLRSFNSRRLLIVSFLLLAAFPWVYILVTGPALHNGLRHMLFGIPPLVVLMAFAADDLISQLRRKGKRYAGGGWAAIGLLVIFQTLQLVLMHPYQYVSFNLLAGERASIPNRYETEYWFTSSRHLLEALPRIAKPGTMQNPVKVRISGPLDAARPFVPKGFALTDSFAEADYYVSNTTFRTDILAEGEIVYEIRRGGIPIGVIKKLQQSQQ